MQGTISQYNRPGFMTPEEVGLPINGTLYPLGFCRMVYQFFRDTGYSFSKLGLVAGIYRIPKQDCEEIVKELMKQM